MVKKNLEVSVIIPVYNEAKNLSQLLNNLHNQSYPSELIEIIISDNGSTDETAQIVSNFPQVKYILAGDKKTPYYARNQAIKQAKNKIVALSDGNKIPDLTWIENGIKGFRDPKIDLVAGKIKFNNFDSWGGIYDSFKYLNNKRLVSRNKTAVGGNLFFKKELINYVGFFDEDFRSGGDIRWTFKATNVNGHKICYVDDAIVYYEPRSLIGVYKKDYRVGKGQIQIWREKKFTFRKKIYLLLKNIIPPVFPDTFKEIKNHLEGFNLFKGSVFFLIIYFGNLIRNLGRIEGIIRDLRK